MERGTHLTMEFRPPVPPPGLSAYLAPGPSSFTDFVTANAPHLLPGRLGDGSPIGSYRSLYIVTLKDGRWAIQGRSSWAE